MQPARDAATGAVTVSTITPHIADAVYTGRVTAALIERAVRETVALHNAHPIRWEIIDATAVHSVDPTIRAAASDAMKRLKELNISTVVIVQHSPARMLGSALAFAVGFSMRFAATRDEALAILRAEKAL